MSDTTDTCAVAQAEIDPEFEAFSAWFRALPEHEKIGRQQMKDGWMAHASTGAVSMPAEASRPDDRNRVGVGVEPVATRIWIDCEFNEHAGRHELISMALVAEDGREWYEVLPCPRPGSWVAEHVMPILGKPPLPHNLFADGLREFLAPYAAIHIIGDWPSDIALFCDALITAPGCRIDTPPLTLEVIRLDGESELPHNALADARGIRGAHLAALAAPPTNQGERHE